MSNHPNCNLSLSLVYARTSNEMFILLLDSKGRNIRVPLSLWKSTHLRLCMLRREDEDKCGNTCIQTKDRNVRIAHALHLSFSDKLLWLTLHAVSGRRHSKKSVQFERGDIVQLLTVSRHAIVEAAAVNARQRRADREKRADAQTSTD